MCLKLGQEQTTFIGQFWYYFWAHYPHVLCQTIIFIFGNLYLILNLLERVTCGVLLSSFTIYFSVCLS
jgi:hypothetical protein